MRFADGFKGAVGFITVLPGGSKTRFAPGEMIPFFPVVGLLLGLILAVFDAVAGQLWPPLVAGALDLLLLTALTGALHLDGLGDTADGLYGRRSREKALSVMKDSRVGAMGLVTVCLVLILKWAGIAHMGENRWLFLLIIPAYGRGAMIFGFRFLEYGRPEGGTGSDFFEKKPKISAFGGLLIPILFSFFAGWQGLLLILAFGLTVFGVLFYYQQKIGCITGDMLGAMCEITEAALFLVAAMGGWQ